METPAFAPLATALLRDGTGLRFRAAGRSMHPTIRDGDLLTVRPIANPGWRRGEMLLCLGSGGDVVAHRLLRIDRGGGKAVRLAIRGDAACGACDWIPPESVLGCVTVRERGGRQQSLDRPLPRLVGLIRAARQSLRGWWRPTPES
jgi:hypothetical protein